MEETDLFQRRETLSNIYEHERSTGIPYENSRDKNNYSKHDFKPKSSGKVVDYGHGNNQGRLLIFQKTVFHILLIGYQRYLP